MPAPTTAPTVEAIAGVAHWVTMQHQSGPIRLYAWEKYLPSREGSTVHHSGVGALRIAR